MTKEDWDRAFGCFWFGVECCDIFSSKVNFRSSNTKLCYNCLVSVYLLISLRARLQVEVDIKMAASKFFLSLMIFLTSHGKSRGRENTSLFYYNSEKCRRLLKQEINERRLHADKQLYAY